MKKYNLIKYALIFELLNSDLSTVNAMESEPDYGYGSTPFQSQLNQQQVLQAVGILDARPDYSDHPLIFTDVNGVRIFSYNIWAPGTRNGFNVTQENIQQRLDNLIAVITHNLNKNLNSVFMIQEFADINSVRSESKKWADYIKNQLVKFGFQVETKTPLPSSQNPESFGNAFVYKPNHIQNVQLLDARQWFKNLSLQKAGEVNQADRTQAISGTLNNTKFLFLNGHFKWNSQDDRMNLINALQADMAAIRSIYPDCTIVIGGDFNRDLRGFQSNDTSIKILPSSAPSLTWNGSQSVFACNDAFIVAYSSVPAPGLKSNYYHNTSSKLENQFDFNQFIQKSITGHLQGDIKFVYENGLINFDELKPIGNIPFRNQRQAFFESQFFQNYIKKHITGRLQAQLKNLYTSNHIDFDQIFATGQTPFPEQILPRSRR